MLKWPPSSVIRALVLVSTLHLTPRLAAQTYAISTLAGAPDQIGASDGTGAAARFQDPRGLAYDAAGNLYVADHGNAVIRKVSPAGVVTTLAGVAGVHGHLDGPASQALFFTPIGIAVDSAGNVYVADALNSDIREITPGGTVSTLAGSESSGFADGTGSAAQFDGPTGVAVDSAGTLYVADAGNNAIRKITAAGVVTTLAGGARGAADGVGRAATFANPVAVATDSSGNLYVADQQNDTLRQITVGGVVTTIAGFAGQNGSADGSAGAARFDMPGAITVDGSGNLYVADTGNSTIRRVGADGQVVTLAGLANDPGSTDGVGLAARFDAPSGIAISSSGSLVVADSGNQTLRSAVPAAGTAPVIAESPQSVTCVAGGTAAFTVSATGGPGLSYQWYRNGAALPGETAPLLVLEEVNSANAAGYSVAVRDDYGSLTSAAAALTVVAATATPGRLVNLSTRSWVATGSPLIAGFTIAGGSKQILVRGIGPGLAAFGIEGSLPDPVLTLQATSGAMLASAAAWGGQPQLADIFADVGAFSLASTSQDAALDTTLAPGPYSVQLSGASGDSGTAMAEIYDADPAGAAGSLVNLSARTQVGATPLVAGFAVGGATGATVLIRGIGPGLSQFGVADALAQVQIQLLDSAGRVMAANAAWGGSATLAAQFSKVGAFGLAAGSSDAVVMATLPAGMYTAQMGGVGGATGQALLEIYLIP